MANKYPKFRKSTWLNKSTGKPLYGIQAKPEPGGKWADCCDGSMPCFYESEEERGLKLAEVKEAFK